MNKDQQEKLQKFYENFSSSINDIKGYLNTKETVKTPVMSSFLNGLELIVENYKKDIEGE